jgi:hypothetical protein
METTIKIFRLNSGEDIISEVEKKENKYKLFNPIVFMLRNDNKSGNQVMNMTFWLPASILNKNQTVIDCKDILAKMDPSDDFAEYYIGAVESINNSKAVALKTVDNNTKMSDDDMMSILDEMSLGNGVIGLH